MVEINNNQLLHSVIKFWWESIAFLINWLFIDYFLLKERYVDTFLSISMSSVLPCC